MKHETFPGAWYADALPTGERAVLFPLSRIVQTHERDLPAIAGDYPLFLDSFADSNGYKVAGKGHDSYTTWEWLYTQWVPHDEAIGNFSVIYDHAGALHISKAGPIGVQGWRQEFDGRLITGDESYGPLATSTNPPDGLTEFSQLGDGVVIGQGWQSGGVCVWDGATLRLLQPGACYDVKAKRRGDVVALAFYVVEPDGLTAHVITATMDELRALPPVAAAVVVVPPPQPKPTPPPEPKPMSQAPNEFAVVQRVFAAHPEINRLSDETRGRLIDYVIAELGGKPWGRKSKNKEGTNLNTDGLTYLRTDGRYEIYDVIDGTTGNPSWDGGEPVVQGENGWWAPGLPVDGPSVPPPNSGGNLASVLTAAGAAALDATIAKLAARITALESAKPPEQKPVSIDGARIALKTDNGHYLCAENGGGGEVNATRNSAGGWETFTVETK